MSDWDTFWRMPETGAKVTGALRRHMDEILDRLRQEVREVAEDIVRKHPDWSTTRQLANGMKRMRGSVNPLMMSEALDIARRSSRT